MGETLVAEKPEGKIKKNIINPWLEKMKAHKNMPVTRGFGTSGVLDYVTCIRGLYVAIEAKAPGRRGEANQGLSRLQVDEFDKITKAGGFAWRVDCQEDLDELEFHLNTGRRLTNMEKLIHPA